MSGPDRALPPPGIVDRSGPRRRVAAWALMVASGFAGLGYQIVWTQQAASWLGHESAAVLAVVTAFFGGLAVGAATLGPAIERSDRPVRWYAGCELGIGAWGLVLAWGMAPASALVVAWTGPTPTPVWQWSVGFVVTFVLLLPATAAMGATLPAIERIVSRTHDTPRSIGALYAANTFGATLGVLATAFWLIPAIGLARTAGVCVVLNLLCAAAAATWRARDLRVASTSSTDTRSARRRVGTLLAATGLFGIGYEVLVVRVLSEVSEDTVYTFALLLAVYLVCSAVGAAAFQRWFARDGGDADRAARTTDRLLVGLAAACLASTGALWAAEAVQASVVDSLGPGMAAALAGEAVVALVAFAAPSVVMGALFSQLCARALATGIGFGRALASNVAGAAVAPIVFGVVLLPWLGAKGALLLVPLGYLAATRMKAWQRPGVWATASAGIAFAVWSPPLRFVDVPEDGRVVRYDEGAMAAVSVVADRDDVMRLRIDNRAQEGSSATGLVDGRQAVLPLLLHPAPHRALFLGLGTGITASTAAADPDLEVDAVELLPEVIDASGLFVPVSTSRLHVLQADARRYVRASPKRYDVVVADNFHPARAGAGALYTVEHFAAIRDVLATDGLFCQWLPLHQLDLTTLRSIARSFVEVFPDGHALLASNSLGTPVIGLVGGHGRRRFDPASIRARLASATPRPDAFGVEDEYALLGSFVAGPRALAAFADGAERNTDDQPVVAYQAPRITYAPDTMPHERLIALLREWSVEPGELLATSTPPEFTRRLAAYRAARVPYLLAGIRTRPSADVDAMLAQVREPLLAVLRISPDFRPAYDPLLRMGRAMEARDPVAARALSEALKQIRRARAASSGTPGETPHGRED